MKTIADMTTAEMVAEYNTLTGKSIKKFSSRGAGEKQLAKAREANPQPAVVEKTAPKAKAEANPQPAVVEKTAPKEKAEAEIKKPFNYAVDGCPSCGATEDQTAAGLDGTNAGDYRNFCHHCLTEYWRDTGKIYKAPAKSEKRSAAISESWNDAEIAAKRSRRDQVMVNGSVHRSVRAAFAALKLPMGQHIKFRMALKEAGVGVYEHGDKEYEFTLVDKG